MRVTIYTPPGAHAEQMRKRTAQMMLDLGIDANIEVDSDEFDFARAGVMFTPAVSVNGTLITNGWMPEVHDMAAAVGRRY